MIKKALLAMVAVAAAASTPAWALPSQAPSNQGTARAPETTPVGSASSHPSGESNPGTPNRSETGSEHAGGGEPNAGVAPATSGSGNGEGHRSEMGSKKSEGKGQSGSEHGKSHRCKPHGVAYVAAGSLVKWSLTEEAGSKHHTYEGEVTVAVTRTNHHAREAKGEEVTYTLEKAHVRGPVPVEQLAKGDRVRVIGKITFLPKRCEAGEEFKPTVTIRRIVVHRPPHTTTEESTEESTSTTTTTSSSTT